MEKTKAGGKTEELEVGRRQKCWYKPLPVPSISMDSAEGTGVEGNAKELGGSSCSAQGQPTVELLGGLGV